MQSRPAFDHLLLQALPYSPLWPWTGYPPASASQAPELQTCTTDFCCSLSPVLCMCVSPFFSPSSFLSLSFVSWIAYIFLLLLPFLCLCLFWCWGVNSWLCKSLAVMMWPSYTLTIFSHSVNWEPLQSLLYSSQSYSQDWAFCEEITWFL